MNGIPQLDLELKLIEGPTTVLRNRLLCRKIAVLKDPRCLLWLTQRPSNLQLRDYGDEIRQALTGSFDSAWSLES
jgi:hypothetical protein